MNNAKYTLHDLARAMMAAGLEWETDETAESAASRVLTEVRRRIKAVASELSTIDRSPLIDFTYAPSVRADRNQAARRIVLRALFEALHPGVTLFPYRGRENLKHEAWKQVGDTGLPVPARVEGAEQVIAAHYARSALSSLDASDPLSFVRHPGLPEYTRHYLHAAPDFWRDRFGDDVAGELLARYPAPVLLRIGAGKTYWGSADMEGAHV